MEGELVKFLSHSYCHSALMATFAGKVSTTPLPQDVVFSLGNVIRSSFFQRSHYGPAAAQQVQIAASTNLLTVCAIQTVDFCTAGTSDLDRICK